MALQQLLLPLLLPLLLLLQLLPRILLLILPVEADVEGAVVVVGMALPTTDRPDGGILRDCEVRGERERSRDVHSLTVSTEGRGWLSLYF